MAGNILSNFLYRDHSPIGLDVGHDSMKMLQLRRRTGQWEVAAGGIHLFNDEQRQNPALRWRQVAQAIQSMLTGPCRLGFRGRRIVAALDYELLLMKNARLPKMPPEEMAEAVRWEAAERFPFDVSAGLVRYLSAGEVRQGGEPREEMLLFAVEEQTLRETLAVLERAGCHPVGLDAQAVALARACGFFMGSPPDGDADTVSAVADVGSQSCQVLIVRSGQIIFVKSIEIGSQDLTRAVVEKVGISPEDTVALRLRLGSEGAAGGAGECANGNSSASRSGTLGQPGQPGQPGAAPEESRVYRMVMAAMRPVAERLAQEITLCLRYYSVTFRGSRPDRITFVGGATHDQLLMHLLGEALGLKVEVGRPLAMCSPSPAICQWGGGVSSGGPEWAVALGCCLKPLAKAPPGQPGQPGQTVETGASTRLAKDSRLVTPVGDADAADGLASGAEYRVPSLK